MSGVSFNFDSAPITLHLARLAVMHQGKFAEMRREIGNYFVEDVKDNLQDQKLFDGSAMPQSKAAQGRTTTWRRSNKKLGRTKGEVRESGKTLIDDHHLYDSYVYQLAGGGIEVGSAKAYAAIHHFGGATGRGHKTKVLARPVMGIAARQELQIGYLLIKSIKELQ